MRFRELMLRTAALVAVATLAACGGGSGKSTSSSSSPSTASSDVVSSDRNSTEIAADLSAAQAALLTLADLPAGWEGKPRDPSTSNTPEAKAATKTFGDCLGADPALFDDSAGSGTKAKSDKFTDGKGLEVETEVTLEANTAIVAKVLTSLNNHGAADCFSAFVKTAAAFGLAHPSNGKPPPAGMEIGDPSVAAVSLPGLPAGSVVYRVTLPFTVSKVAVNLFLDFVFVGLGRAELTLSFQNVGDPFPDALEAQLVTTAVGRLPA